MAEQRGAAAGLCKALPRPRSHSTSMEAQSIPEIHMALLAEGLAIHSVVLLPQDTPRMAGCYGQPLPHPLPECLLVCMERRRVGGGVRKRVRKEEECKEGNGLLVLIQIGSD